MAERLIIDAGGVIGFARGDRVIRAAIERAAADGLRLVVPPAVVTQTVRGGGRDALIHRLLGGCVVPPVDLRVARIAGELLGRTGGTDVADAQIAAEAISGGPAVVLTGGVDDLALLVDGFEGVRLQPI